MKYYVDRLEGKYAVLEDENGETADVLLSVLPGKTEEGSVLTRGEDGAFALAPESEAERKRILKSLQDSLFSS